MREPPIELLGRLKLGREEYVQRLVTMLIVGGPYPRWNHPSVISEPGVEFLQRLEALSFGATTEPSDALFVDEFDLPRRTDAEAGGASDWAVVTPQRLWLIELKTEVASHRHGQIPLYFELGAHHHLERALDITYLTPTMTPQRVAVIERQRFAHVTWDQVLVLLQSVWADSDEWSTSAVTAVTEVLAGLGTRWSEWRGARLGSDEPAVVDTALDRALAIAAETAVDGLQRAIELQPDDLEFYQQLRVDVRDAIAAADDASLARVRPWLWSAESSGGTALTGAGAEVGYEIRLSRY